MSGGVEALKQRVTGTSPFFPVFVLFGFVAIDQLDVAAFSVLLPNIRDSFGLNLTGVLTLITVIAPVNIGLAILVGYFADRAPRVMFARAGAIVWAVFSTFTGLAVNVYQIALARVGTAIGVSVNTPTHNSLLSDYYPPQVRPAVYAFHGAALQVGNIIGPMAAGFIAFYFGWRAPFILAAIPTAVFVVLSLRLHEPKRGFYDRLAAGATDEEAAVEETPPSFSEAWRMLFAVKSLRRLYAGLPFIGVTGAGLASLMSLFYADVFRLNEAERGVITSLQQPFALAGLIVGAGIADRLMKRDPGLVLRLVGVSGVVTGICIGLIAAAPTIHIAVAASFVQAAVTALLLPAIFAVFSVAIPARTRSLGFVSSQIFLLPGYLLLPVVGRIGDEVGLRAGIAILIPLYVIGAFILGSAGKFLAGDVEMVRVASLAEQEVRKALSEGEPKLLLVRRLDVAYDQVQVLFGVDLELKPGEMVALLGTNGAGKSTVLKAISGLVDPAAGAIYFDGIDITHMDPVSTVQRGIVYMPGGRSVFPTLPVKDHFELAAWMLKDDPEHVSRATEEMLAVFPRLKERWEQPAGNLSGGEQQMLGLSMSLVAKPQLLMIDELSLGLAPTIVETLLDVLRRIHAQGTAVILVEQSVNVALTVADRAYFMEKGEVRFSGRTSELLERDDILRAVFLQGAAAAVPDAPPARARADKRERSAVSRSAPPVLELSNVSRSFGGITAVDDVSFKLYEHEVLGLIGPNGAGKTTIFDLISGFLDVDTGTIVLGGTDVTRMPPHKRALAGLGRSFQDARIFPSLTVAENIAVSLERHLDVRDPIADTFHLPVALDQEMDVRFTAEELIELLSLGAFRDKFVSELSTGSRRIADLAMAIAHNPTVLILDEPSSGIAQRETEALIPLLQRIQREIGCAMLVIEHDMPLVTTISDRMLALELGKIIAEGTPEEVTTNARVVTSYLGGDIATVQRSGNLGKAGRRPSKRNGAARAAAAATTSAGGERRAGRSQ